MNDPARLTEDEITVLRNRLVELARTESDEPVTRKDFSDLLTYLSVIVPDFLAR